MGLGPILNQARDQEREYDWMGAVESYGKALGSVSETDSYRRGQVQERVGYALYRAALQAESAEEFRERIHKAIISQDNAKRCYERSGVPEKSVRTLRCDAMTAFMNYWLASEASEKKKSLAVCWRLTEETLRVSKELGNVLEYGEIFTQLSASALLWFCLEWDYQTRKKIIKEVADDGEVGVKLLSTINEPDELAKTCAKTAFALSLFAYFFLDLEEKKECLRRAQGYWTRAKEASEDSARLEMLCPVPCAHDHLLGFGSEEALTNLEKALERARKTRDKFFIGSALDWLTYHTEWTLTWTDDFDESQRVWKTVLQYAEEAKRQYSVISFTSPRADFAWVEAIYATVPGATFQLRKRHNILRKAIAAGRGAIEPAETSGYPQAIMYVHYFLSFNLRWCAEFESSIDEKEKLLDEALQHGKKALEIGERIEPLSYWDLGLFRENLAALKCGMAELAKDFEIKKNMLQAAILERENGVKLMVKDVSYHPQKNVAAFPILGDMQSGTGDWWTLLYRLTCDNEHLRRSAEVFTEALKYYQKLDLASRGAECYWKIAQAYDELGEHLKAASNFCLASDAFKGAAGKILQLKSFYQDHACYMEAWSEIEKARHHHEKQEYGLAKEHFQNAANMHKSLKQWGYLAANYSAWAQVEHAEDLSRKEQCEEALQAFEQATKLLEESEKSIQDGIGRVEDANERQMATQMIKATDARRQYCNARIAIEEARNLDKKGDHSSSSEKYSSAAVTLQKIARTAESDQEKKEFNLIATLSQAWAKMTRAESEESSDLYVEASKLFEEAKGLSTNENARMLALGHSRFCRALEAGTKFADTRDTTVYTTALRHLESAANYYLKAGFQSASEYAKATGLLFDAYAQMDNANEEMDPEKKVRLCMVAEKVLQSSAGAYMKAQHPEKSQQVQRLLEKVREERELAVSLTEVLRAPTIVSTTVAFTTPNPNKEQAVGVERFEHADVQANIITRQKELKVGEDLNLEMELVNAGKGPALLIKVTDVVPEGFDLTRKPEKYSVENSYVNLKGKRLDPLKTEDLKLVLKPKAQGLYPLKPKIMYLDENGKYKTHEPEPVTINVKELGIEPGIKGELVSRPRSVSCVATGYVDLDRLLYGGLPSNCAVALTSPVCNERDLLVKSFLETGARRGEVTVYVTIDPGVVKLFAREFPSNFHLFVCNPQANVIVEDLPNVFKLKGVENLTDLSIALTSAFRKLDPSQKGLRRICLGLVSDVLLQHHAVQTRRWLTSLLTELKSTRFTTLAVVDPQVHPSEELHAIVGLFDGEFSIFEKQTEKGSERCLKIKRMSNQKYMEDEVILKKTA